MSTSGDILHESDQCMSDDIAIGSYRLFREFREEYYVDRAHTCGNVGIEVMKGVGVPENAFKLHSNSRPSRVLEIFGTNGANSQDYNAWLKLGAEVALDGKVDSEWFPSTYRQGLFTSKFHHRDTENQPFLEAAQLLPHHDLLPPADSCVDQSLLDYNCAEGAAALTADIAKQEVVKTPTVAPRAGTPPKKEVELNPYACREPSPPCESADGYVYQVRFKHQSKYYLLAANPQMQVLRKGDNVKVEADRGVDMGVVTAKLYLDGFKQSKLTVGRYGASNGDFKHVLCRATADEERRLAVKADEEARAADICRTKAFELRLPMNIVDAEFQFDRNKLTFYFEANRRNDFRELVAELYALYKTRIWMQQVEVSHQKNRELLTSARDQDFVLNILAALSQSRTGIGLTIITFLCFAMKRLLGL